MDLSLLESTQRLQREKCARDAVNSLSKDDHQSMQTLQEHALTLLRHDSWEGRHGGLLLVQEYLKWQEQRNVNPPNYSDWAESCLQLSVDREVRVRTSVGETIALLCRLGGLQLFDEKIAGPLLASIENNMTLERDGQAFLDDDEATQVLRQKLLAGEATRQQKPGSSRASRASSMQSSIFHDTAGWGPLETDVNCLQQIIQAYGSTFAPRLVSESEVLELLCNGAVHMNRFVRGTAFRAIDCVIKSLHQADSIDRSQLAEIDLDANTKLLDNVAESSDLIPRICSGLCDEWANVRMEASVALRTLLVSLETYDRRQGYYDQLLPRMCINRYYVAAGVASYSRDTWRLILGDQGKEMVEQWLPSIVPFYIMQTKLANSEARDAAAKCIGELAARIPLTVVSKYADDLFQALVPRLSPEDAWEVKGSVCTAIIEMVRAFPDRFNLSADLSELLSLLSAALADTVWSVREGAAMVLGELVKVSKESTVPSILELCLDGLLAAAKETDERQKYGKEDLVELKRLRDNDVILHSNKDTIDCCAVGELDEDDSEQLQELGKLSLSRIYNEAQKHKLDLGQNRWERTDGCLYLVRELALGGRCMGASSCKLDATKQTSIEDAFPLMVRVAALRHFMKHLTVLTTLWKVLPEIAKALGVDSFKQYFPGFVEPLAYGISCNDGLTVDAAKKCVAEIQVFLGRDCFEGCMQLCDEASVDVLAACLVQK